MRISEIDVMKPEALYTITLWGFGCLKALIDALYYKAQDAEGGDLDFLIATIESHTEDFELKLQELDEKYIRPLENKYRNEVTA